MGDDYHVVAVVGDGALTGGMCYEALNDAGQSGTRLIVVINDNEMSISHNVGALSNYLTGLRSRAPTAPSSAACGALWSAFRPGRADVPRRGEIPRLAQDAVCGRQVL